MMATNVNLESEVRTEVEKTLADYGYKGKGYTVKEVETEPIECREDNKEWWNTVEFTVTCVTKHYEYDHDQYGFLYVKGLIYVLGYIKDNEVVITNIIDENEIELYENESVYEEYSTKYGF